MSFAIALAALVLTFGGGIAGLYLKTRLPEEHMSGGSRDMILAVIGLLTLLLALVLGTLVGNTYAFFATQKSELETLASRAILLDQALSRYGPEGKPPRDRMKEELTKAYKAFWGGGKSDPAMLGIDVALKHWRPIVDYLQTLSPSTEAQKSALSEAKTNVGLMEQTRLLMSLQLASPITWSLLVVVMAWSMFLFCGFGVLSGANATTIVALALGAISVASAMFLILDLSQPYTGFYRISPKSLEQAIAAIDR
jgi:hypothetical protein